LNGAEQEEEAMLTQVEGVIRNGQVKLPRDVKAADGTRVMVTFLEDRTVDDTMDPFEALEFLAEIRRDMPPMDVVEMTREIREDLAARGEP
jgi:hypothetical protein